MDYEMQDFSEIENYGVISPFTQLGQIEIINYFDRYTTNRW